MMKFVGDFYAVSLSPTKYDPSISRKEEGAIRKHRQQRVKEAGHKLTYYFNYQTEAQKRMAYARAVKKQKEVMRDTGLTDEDIVIDEGSWAAL